MYFYTYIDCDDMRCEFLPILLFKIQHVKTSVIFVNFRTLVLLYK